MWNEKNTSAGESICKKTFGIIGNKYLTRYLCAIYVLFMYNVRSFFSSFYNLWIHRRNYKKKAPVLYVNVRSFTTLYIIIR